MVSPGDLVELVPEKPVVGGRMLARVGGEVVLVSGAIPGERVVARIERRQQGVVFAATVEVRDPSPDRRDPGPDAGCGGMTFAHIAYDRQCALKASIVADALVRIGRVSLAPPPLTPSPPVGYRMRYRVHYAEGKVGFFREGSHDVCDPAHSGQLAPSSLEVLSVLAARVAGRGLEHVVAFECMENLETTERVVNLAMRPQSHPPAALLAAVAATPGVTGVSWTDGASGRLTASAGLPWVSDPIARFADAGGQRGKIESHEAAGDSRPDAPTGEVPSIRRHAPSFFQANRFVTPRLARTVVALGGEGPLVDLYAGVGLFAVCAAWAGCPRVLAIEADRASGLDLEENVKPFGDRVRVRRSTVEDFFRGGGGLDGVTLIVDPPRTGMSRVAVQGILASRASRIVYVSCDVATLARDARRLLDHGYELRHVEAFDLFPNTAHVEGLALFERTSA